MTPEKLKEFEDWLAKKNGRKSKKSAAKSPAKGRIRKSTPKTEDKPKSKRKRIRSKPKPGFSEETRTAAHNRSGGLCENPLCGRNLPGLGGEHHCLPRSQYRKADRNDLWNCAAICEDCHRRVTSPKTPEDKRLRRYFERLAVFRRDYTGDEFEFQRSALTTALERNTLDLIRSFEPFTQA